jgi:hypothetical protein
MNFKVLEDPEAWNFTDCFCTSMALLYTQALWIMLVKFQERSLYCHAYVCKSPVA